MKKMIRVTLDGGKSFDVPMGPWLYKRTKKLAQRRNVYIAEIIRHAVAYDMGSMTKFTPYGYVHTIAKESGNNRVNVVRDLLRRYLKNRTK